nr:vesicle associated membrane protein [Hymenolepis microstoma]
MSILYAAVCCGSRVLCEQAIGSIDYGKAVRTQLENSVQEFITCPLEGYVAVTSISTSQQQTLNFLKRVYAAFTSDQSRILEAQSGSEHCHQVDFGRTLSAMMADFNSQSATRLMDLRNQVNDVTLIMQQNLEDLNEREGRLDDVYGKAENFQKDAEMFQSTAKRVKEKTYWENCRMRLLLFGCIFVILFIILMIILWQANVFDREK